MPAGVSILRITGAAATPTATDITSINTRANAIDAHSTADVNSSILVPATGTGPNYSFWVVTRLNVNTITSGTVNNIKWFTDGSNNFGTGVTALVNTATGYVQATGTVGVTGTALSTAAYTTLAAAPVNPFTYVDTAPLAVAGSTTTTGQFGDYVVYQLVVADTAASGATAQETFTWRYDDTSS